LAELTDAKGNHVDENLRILDLFEGALHQFLFHKTPAKLAEENGTVRGMSKRFFWAWEF
jgi:hypothetical protein